MDNPSGKTSTSLIARVRLHDRASWERFCRIYGPMIYDWAKSTGLQSNDCADIMQEVLESVSQKLDRFQKKNERDSFRGWLWTVTRNKVRDHFRRLQIQEDAAGGSTALLRIQELPETPYSSSSIDGQSESRKLWARALELVQTDFEPQTWQAFYRAVINGESAKEIAADLNLSPWAVYKAKSRILHRLREEFDGLFDELNHAD